MRAKAASLALYLAVTFASAEALAANDTIILQDGTVLTGTATEIVPGLRVVLSDGKGSTTIPWSRVRQISRDGRPLVEAPPNAMPPPPPPKPAPEPPPAPAPPPPERDRSPENPTSPAEEPSESPGDKKLIRVTLETREPDVQVEELDRSNGSFFVVCDRVCGEPLVTGTTYRTKLNGIPSSTFRLHAANGPSQRIAVRPPVPGARGGFIALTSISGAAILGGGLMVAAGSDRSSLDANLTAPGVALAISGAALLSVSIPMIVLSGRSQVEVGPARALADGRDQSLVVPMPSVQSSTILGGSF